MSSSATTKKNYKIQKPIKHKNGKNKLGKNKLGKNKLGRQKNTYRAPNFDKNIRTLITPEGIDLRLRLADTGTRIGAFLIDLILMIIALILLLLITGKIFIEDDREIASIILILGAFLLRNFYFMFFEMGGKGATLGKRLLKIRVASRNGGHLTANAVFARNALREVEFFLPLGLVFSLSGDINGWINLMALVWSLIFLFFPLFNKDKLRAGDLIAGTWVVNAPRLRLSKDLSATPTVSDGHSKYRFSAKQIDAYGVRELHVLENILRMKKSKSIAEVSARIITKIQWKDGHMLKDNEVEQRAFLNAYYAALRGSLEAKLLFGVRRKDKFDRR
ncbi:MAG: hypothetical protein COA43_15580 [Robiginitomaculum sp.]|nr:MAG: hypothetical protein COA43_15580 [Robiginitomaculum sp.]